jgi:hypothetical protein
LPDRAAAARDRLDRTSPLALENTVRRDDHAQAAGLLAVDRRQHRRRLQGHPLPVAFDDDLDLLSDVGVHVFRERVQVRGPAVHLEHFVARLQAGGGRG